MTKIKEINHQIHLLFQQYGIKSLTMDDLANKLGCSKKHFISIMKIEQICTQSDFTKLRCTFK